MKYLMSTSALIAGLAATSAAYAQGITYYYGGGIEYSMGTSDTVFTPSEGTVGGVTLLFGMEAPLSGPYFYGGEASFTYNFSQDWTYDNGSCGPGGTGPYACELDYAARVVGIFGYDMGSFDLFANAGVGYVTGTYDFNTATGNNYGYTAGIGVRYDIGNGLKIRGEFIYDYLIYGGVATFDTEWTATTARITLTKNF